jgi:hypothetical protein
VTSVVQLLCRTTKLCWYDDDAFRKIVDDSKRFLDKVRPKLESQAEPTPLRCIDGLRSCRVEASRPSSVFRQCQHCTITARSTLTNCRPIAPALTVICPAHVFLTEGSLHSAASVILPEHTSRRLQGSAGSPGHYLLGLRVLNMLVLEMNQPTPGRTLTQHRKIAVSFRDLVRMIAHITRMCSTVRNMDCSVYWHSGSPHVDVACAEPATGFHDGPDGTPTAAEQPLCRHKAQGTGTLSRPRLQHAVLLPTSHWMNRCCLSRCLLRRGAMLWVGSASSRRSTGIGRGSNEAQWVPLLLQAVSLALQCLSFDFVGTCLDESSEDLGTIQARPPCLTLKKRCPVGATMSRVRKHPSK